MLMSKLPHKNKKLHAMCVLIGHKTDGSWTMLARNQVELICVKCKSEYIVNMIEFASYQVEKYYLKKPPTKSR